MLRWQWFEHADAVRDAALAFIARAAAEAITARGEFHIVLAGGSTPRAVYQSLCQVATDWGRWHIHFGDERVLPADHSDRNSKMADDAWLSQVPIPANQIHPIPTELGLEAACAAYREHMARTGEFDLVLLGLGEDGHTASLFPGQDPGSGPDAPDVLMVRDAPKPPPERLSLSAHRLSRTRHVLFLVTGAGKRDPVTRWKRGERIPAAAIRCDNGIDVLLDSAANAEA